MKKILFLMTSMLVLTLTTFGQTSKTELIGAIGLTFGSDKATVNSILSTKGTYHEMNKSDAVAFLDVSIGSKRAGFVLCKFVDNKLCRIVCSFTPETDSKAQELYDDFTTILTNKYGNATNSFRNFKYPFEDKAEDIDLAISSGLADICSFWLIPDKLGNSVELSINKDYSVIIEYQSKTLMDILIERQKSKNADAF